MNRKEGYAYIDTLNPNALDVTPISRITPFDGNPVEVTNAPESKQQLPSWKMAEKSKSSANSNNVITSYAQPLTFLEAQDSLPTNYNNTSKIRPGCTPVTDMLIPETSTMVYNDEFFEQPNANLFLQNIQPNIYSYAVDTTPINSLASGITYTPQIPTRFRDQVYNSTDGLTYPIYTRIDPQLIRDQGVPARLLEQPVRGDWSAKYSGWEAAPGSYNYEDIYDPRYQGAGDPYRSYSDVMLGNVQYYYGDVDSYRIPNFVTRSKTDFIEFTNPQGKVLPHYQRTAGLNDARPFVDNTWMNDSLYFRESIMESNMRPANARAWQQRYAPLSRASHSYTKSG